MVTVTYRPDKHELKFKGHANKGLIGKDPICASISMSFYNICAMISEYPKECFVNPPEIKVAKDKRGVSSISCTPTSAYENTINHDFYYCLIGLELLQANFPEAIELKVMQK